MFRAILPLGALLLAPMAAWSQQTTAPQKTTAAHHRRTSGGGNTGPQDDPLAIAPMKVLPCPKGFKAQITSGPHLKTTDAAPVKSRRKTSAQSAASPPATKKALARRCVPVSPNEEAQNSGDATPPPQVR